MIEHLRGRDRKLKPLGWTGDDAEWIALVCLHSGVFTRAQFCHYFDASRKRAERFVKALMATPISARRANGRSSTAERRRVAYRARRSTGR